MNKEPSVAFLVGHYDLDWGRIDGQNKALSRSSPQHFSIEPQPLSRSHESSN